MVAFSKSFGLHSQLQIPFDIFAFGDECCFIRTAFVSFAADCNADGDDVEVLSGLS
jgi:hypothetical protein